MGFLDSVKNRLALNLKLTKISFMVNRNDIVQACQAMSKDERAGALNSIEGMFRWQPIAQIAGALFPNYYSSGVSDEALDLVRGGYVQGGVDLMRSQSQPIQPQYGMLPIQQAALSFAWLVLKAFDQRDATAALPPPLRVPPPPFPGTAPPTEAKFCSACGTPRFPGGRFCGNCGAPFVEPTPEVHVPNIQGAGPSANQFSQTSSASTGEHDELFRQLQTIIHQGQESGDVTAERADALKSVVERFQALTQAPASSPTELAARSAQMHELVGRFKGIYTTPKAATNCAERVSQLFSGLRAYLFDEGNKGGMAQGERNNLLNLLKEAGHVNFALQGAKDDAAIGQLEHDQIRPLILGVRRFALRRNLMVVEPFLGWSPVEVNPNRVFFAGGDDLRQKVSSVCKTRDLELAESAAGWGAAQMRWNQLRECALAVFDFTSGSKEDWPSVCYSLGTALALGVNLVVVVDTASVLPFDLDVHPVQSDGDLGEALDEALFSVPRVETGAAISDTAGEVLRRCDQQDATTAMLRKSLSGTVPDMMEVESSLNLLASLNGRGKWALTRPTWSGFYPTANDRRCFHIMPFSEPWSDDAREAVRSACGERAKYRRGDETGDPNVIRSIWEEICRATDVIVDLTGLNLNVCLELAVCQTLGRRTLLLARSDSRTISQLFPEIAKLQVHHYQTHLSLEKTVEQFLTRA